MPMCAADQQLSPDTVIMNKRSPTERNAEWCPCNEGSAALRYLALLCRSTPYAIAASAKRWDTTLQIEGSSAEVRAVAGKMSGDGEADGTEAWGLAAVAAVDHDPGDEAAAQQEEMLSDSERGDPVAAVEPAPADEPEPVPESQPPVSESATPKPVALDAVAPEPAAPEPAAPEPAAPEPAATEPVAIQAAAPEPVAPEPAAPTKMSDPEDNRAPAGQAVEPGPRQPSPAPLVVKSTLKGPPVVTKDTSLHHCAKEGDIEKLKAVLQTMDNAEIIATLKTLDTDGWSPLHYAAVNSSTACLQELVAAGRGIPEVLNARSKEGQTALHFAVVWECPDHVQLLLQAGADVDATNEFDATPLHWACERGAHDVMRVLLDHSPPANAELVDDCGRTPLHVAAENEMLREAMILVKECRVRVDCRDRRGKTPFELASPEVCQVLQQACGISGSQGSASDRETGTSADLDVEFYEWVSANGLQAYIGIFRTHAIDLESLKVLEESHLSEMGIPIGARMKILTGTACPQPLEPFNAVCRTCAPDSA